MEVNTGSKSDNIEKIDKQGNQKRIVWFGLLGFMAYQPLMAYFMPILFIYIYIYIYI